MSLLAQGNMAMPLVPAGRVLRVAANGSASVQVGSNAAATINAVSQDYGPYASDTLLTIKAVSASLDYTLLARDMREVVVSTSAPSGTDGRPDGTVYIQS